MTKPNRIDSKARPFAGGPVFYVSGRPGPMKDAVEHALNERLIPDALPSCPEPSAVARAFERLAAEANDKIASALAAPPIGHDERLIADVSAPVADAPTLGPWRVDIDGVLVRRADDDGPFVADTWSANGAYHWRVLRGAEALAGAHPFRAACRGDAPDLATAQRDADAAARALGWRLDDDAPYTSTADAVAICNAAGEQARALRVAAPETTQKAAPLRWLHTTDDRPTVILTGEQWRTRTIDGNVTTITLSIEGEPADKCYRVTDYVYLSQPSRPVRACLETAHAQPALYRVAFGNYADRPHYFGGIEKSTAPASLAEAQAYCATQDALWRNLAHIPVPANATHDEAAAAWRAHVAGREAAAQAVATAPPVFLEIAAEQADRWRSPAERERSRVASILSVPVEHVRIRECSGDGRVVAYVPAHLSAAVIVEARAVWAEALPLGIVCDIYASEIVPGYVHGDRGDAATHRHARVRVSAGDPYAEQRAELTRLGIEHSYTGNLPSRTDAALLGRPKRATSKPRDANMDPRQWLARWRP